MIIDYEQWAKEVWEVAHGESWVRALIGDLCKIESKLRRMIFEYEKNKSKHLGSTIKFNSKQSQ